MFGYFYIAFVTCLLLFIFMSILEIISFGVDELGFSLMDVIICIIIIISFFIFIPIVKIENNLTKKLRLIFILAMIIIVGLISKGIIWFPHLSKIPPPLGASLPVLLIMLV